MEKIMGEMQNSSAELRSALEGFRDGQKSFSKLIDYYGSAQWMSDYEADEKGKLPAPINTAAFRTFHNQSPFSVALILY